MGNREKNELAFSRKELEAIERARQMPISFDEDCPETTPERALRFKRVNPPRDSLEKTTISITVPRGMVPFVEELNQEHEFVRNAMILYPLIRRNVISHGRAAEILGVHKFDLIDFYGAMGISYLNQSREELEDEIEDCRKLEGALVHVDIDGLINQ